MLALSIAFILILLPVLALAFYVVQRSQPGRFRLNATLLKLVSINIEVDAQREPDMLPCCENKTAKLPYGPKPIELTLGEVKPWWQDARNATGR